MTVEKKFTGESGRSAWVDNNFDFARVSMLKLVADNAKLLSHHGKLSSQTIDHSTDGHVAYSRSWRILSISVIPAASLFRFFYPLFL